MALRLIREASDTPNVANTDDARMVRYAYGGYDGYVKDRGTELGYKAVGSVFTVTSGVVVLQGWESEIDGNGIEIDVGLNATKRYHAVYYEVNGALGTAEIKETYQTTTYPEISTGDDLTTNTEGTARLLLYTFTSQNGEISSASKKVGVVEYGKEIASTINNTIKSNVNIIDSKIRSIEGRLQRLGFKSGYVILRYGSGGITLTRQGNYVIATIQGNSNNSFNNPVAVLPEQFIPKTSLIVLAGAVSYVNTSSFTGKYYGQIEIEINKDGNVNLGNFTFANGLTTTGYINNMQVQLGWEANPIESEA